MRQQRTSASFHLFDTRSTRGRKRGCPDLAESGLADSGRLAAKADPGRARTERRSSTENEGLCFRSNSRVTNCESAKGPDADQRYESRKS